MLKIADKKEDDISKNMKIKRRNKEKLKEKNIKKVDIKSKKEKIKIKKHKKAQTRNF